MNKRQKGRKLVKKFLERIRKDFPDAYEVVGSGAGLDGLNNQRKRGLDITKQGLAGGYLKARKKILK